MEVRMVNTPSADMNNEPVHCFIAIELTKSGWVVGFQTPLSDKTSRYQVKAGDANGLLELIERVRTRVARQLSRPVEAMSCYEAGYDGCGFHRVLEGHGIHNQASPPHRGVARETVTVVINGVEQELEIVRQDRINGGQQAYWLCPRCGAPRCHLYLHNGELAGRCCHRLLDSRATSCIRQ